MAQAVVQIEGSQYFVKPGDSLLVNKLKTDKELLSFSDVLLLIDGNDIKVGQPFVKDVLVTAHIESQTKGDKIRVTKFKAKSRYRKTIGFRQSLTKILIDKIGNPQNISKEDKIFDTSVKSGSRKRVPVKKILTTVKKIDKV
jgi:large subunit ribosomal protein L21